jgi:hypothetical protein
MSDLLLWYASLDGTFKAAIIVTTLIIAFAIVKRLVKFAIAVTLLLILLVVLRYVATTL